MAFLLSLVSAQANREEGYSSIGFLEGVIKRLSGFYHRVM